MWEVWDKQTEINGFSAEDFLSRRSKQMQREETIFIKKVNGRVTQVEGKIILASVYGIDETLSNEEFISEYERIMAEAAEETAAE